MPVPGAPAPGEDFLDFASLGAPAAAAGEHSQRGAPAASDDPFAFGPPSGGSDFGPRGQILTHSVPGTAGPFKAGADPLAQPDGAVTCKVCGKTLTDPFDQALGSCEDCRNETVSPPAAGELSRNSRGGAAPAEVIEQLDIAKPMQVSRRAVQNAAVGSSGPNRNTVLAIAAGVAVLAVVGGVLWVKKPWVRRAPPLAQRLPVGSARPIDAMVERWRAAWPEGLQGSASELMRAGEENLANDTTQGYVDAEINFRKALVLDKSLDQAVAGWALAVAFGRAGQLDAETARMAEQMLTAAGQRSGDNRVFIALAHLMLANGGNFNDVKALAERGLKSASQKDQALAELALGELYRSKSPDLAVKHFASALKLDPKLKRAYLYQARLQNTQGQLREAVASLKMRLELDQDQWEAADTLGQLLVEVGDVASAHQVYQRSSEISSKSVRPKLALAVLAYQHEHDYGRAVERLTALLGAKATLDKRELAEVYGHLAAAERLAGDLGSAAAHAQKGIEAKDDEPNPRVQRFLVAIDQGELAVARAQLPALALGDKALQQALEGRLLLAEGKPAEAGAQLEAAANTDSRRTDALMLGAAAFAKAKNEKKAWELALKRGLKADPQASGPLPVMARTYVRPTDLLKAAKGAFFAMPGHDSEDPNLPLAEGLVAWHAQDYAAAEAAFAKVTSFDTANGYGFAYRSLLASRKKDFAGALKLGQRAVESERKLGLSHYAVGTAQLGLKQVEPARKALRAATEVDPALIAAKVRLAEADIKAKRADGVTDALKTVLLADPSYLDAKRVLYQLGAPAP